MREFPKPEGCHSLLSTVTLPSAWDECFWLEGREHMSGCEQHSLAWHCRAWHPPWECTTLHKGARAEPPSPAALKTITVKVVWMQGFLLHPSLVVAGRAVGRSLFCMYNIPSSLFSRTVTESVDSSTPWPLFTLLKCSLWWSNGMHTQAHAHSWSPTGQGLIPGALRKGPAETQKPHTIICNLQEFCSQASRLSPGNPERTCPPSSAPFLPCKTKKRISLYWQKSWFLLQKPVGWQSGHISSLPAPLGSSLPANALMQAPDHILSQTILGCRSHSSHGHTWLLLLPASSFWEIIIFLSSAGSRHILFWADGQPFQRVPY